jgi:hypothetical protein
MSEHNPKVDRPDHALNALCVLLTIAVAFVTMGMLLFWVFWGGIAAAIVTKSRRTRWAALTCVVTTLLLVVWVTRR